MRPSRPRVEGSAGRAATVHQFLGPGICLTTEENHLNFQCSVSKCFVSWYVWRSFCPVTAIVCSVVSSSVAGSLRKQTVLPENTCRGNCTKTLLFVCSECELLSIHQSSGEKGDTHCNAFAQYFRKCSRVINYAFLTYLQRPFLRCVCMCVCVCFMCLCKRLCMPLFLK